MLKQTPNVRVQLLVTVNWPFSIQKWTPTPELAQGVSFSTCVLNLKNREKYLWPTLSCEDTANKYWMGLKYNKSAETHTWASGVKLEHCHSVRLWENVVHEDILGDVLCYKLAYDTDYLIWKYKSADCAGTADGAVCRSMVSQTVKSIQLKSSYR